jgi:hypothetical protein
MKEVQRTIALFAFALISVAAVPSLAQQPVDTDQDGVDDRIDNCMTIANPTQVDSDADGFGNTCDADLNNDGIVNSIDIGIFKKRFNTTDPDADLNSDGRVNSLDLGLAKTMLFANPGPSVVTPVTGQDLAASPPVPDKVETFAAPQGLGPAPGVVFMTLSSAKRKQFNIGNTILFAPDGQGRVLNDLGLGRDRTANDNIFSGDIQLPQSPAQVRTQLNAIGQKLLNSGTLMNNVFSGRELVQRQFLNPQFGIFEPAPPSPGLTSVPIFVLPFGVHFPPPCDNEKCQVIRDLSVVADPTRTFDPCDSDHDGSLGNVNGVWSFKTLMKNQANTAITGTPAPEFVHYWLSHWLKNEMDPVFTNGHIVPARSSGMNSRITSLMAPNWDPLDPSKLKDSDLDKLPFRLLAIINRNDLAGGGYGKVKTGQPSEIRFVFGLLRIASGICMPDPSGMSVIFEYKDKTKCEEQSARAQQWIDLDSLPLPSAAFNTALQIITDDVTVANANPTGPAGSALNQLRTNDIALGGSWELREHRMNAATQRLELNPLINTPDVAFFNTPALKNCVDNPACLKCIDEQKDQFDPACIALLPPGFLAGSLIYSQLFHFDATGIVNNVGRRDFSQNTCGGCHGANTLDPGVSFGAGGLNVIPPWPSSFLGVPEAFYHVDARTPAGFPARLSRFMEGTDSMTPLAPGAGIPVLTPIPDKVSFSAALSAKRFADLERRGSVLAAQAVPGSCGRGGVSHLTGLVAEPASLVVDPFLIQQQSLKLVH